MNWEQILTEYTKKTESGYVQIKEIDASTFDEMCRTAASWNCCAVGSFMQDLVPGWDAANNNIQGYALDLLQQDAGIDLNEQGTEFFDQLKEGDVAAAMSCYENIKHTVNGMNQTHLTLLSEYLHHDHDDEE